MIDGVFGEKGVAGVVFQSAVQPTEDDVGAVVAVAARRVDRLLQRRSLRTPADEGRVDDQWTDEAPVLAGLAAASVQGRLRWGRCPAQVWRATAVRQKSPPVTFRAVWHPGTGGLRRACPESGPRNRARLERLCRYTLRPAVADARLRSDTEGHVWVALRHKSADGTTRIFASTPWRSWNAWPSWCPGPGYDLVLSYGVLAPA